MPIEPPDDRHLLRPDAPWPRGVGAVMSLRGGGSSRGPYSAWNVGTAVGDDPAAVALNRARLRVACDGAQPVFLTQVHGVRVANLDDAALTDEPDARIEADAAVTTRPGIACVVQVADCMPVLMASADGRAVAAAHAGWRGLAGGVLEATLQALAAAARCDAADVMVWLGPCIGPRQFEVGTDVLEAFGADPADPQPAHFQPRRRADGSPGWLADLPGLARRRLRARGVEQMRVSGECTVEEASRFFSFRRDRVTGRHAVCIWRGRGG